MFVTFVRENITVSVPEGTTVLEAACAAGIRVNSPCGGKGTCGKCKAEVSGREILMCRETVRDQMKVELPEEETLRILETGTCTGFRPDGTSAYVLSFDIGTTTLVGSLLSGSTGETIDTVSMLNPQVSFGADVISRIQAAMDHGTGALSSAVRGAMAEISGILCERHGVDPSLVGTVCVCGNTAMHHLFLGIDPKPLSVPPYMPREKKAVCLPAKEFLPLENAELRVLPNIAGFVGADTVACLLSTGFCEKEELTLLIDIGTNGEMVLGNKKRRIACSTAAGPAFEGAKISCGMHGAEGAIDHCHIEDGKPVFSVIGGGKARGICGSGILDLTACLLDLSIVDESGYMEEKEVVLPGTEVTFTGKDIREVQLAKAAIRTGIELLCKKMGCRPDEIRKVLLAGAFGNFMDPRSACRIGMIPKELLSRIVPVGNAAGEGAKAGALNRSLYEKCSVIAAETEFLELASFPEFEDCFIDSLEFGDL